MNTLEATRNPSVILVSEREAARLLGLSPRSVWSLRASGKLPAVRIGRRVLYKLETLARFVADREGEGAQDRTAGA